MSQSRPPKIMVLITSLNVGGAERMLVKLLPRLSSRVRPMVTTLKSKGSLTEAVRSMGITCYALNLSSPLRALSPGHLRDWLRSVREFSPDLIQTWLYHADLFGSLIAIVLRRPVIWNVRASYVERSSTKVVVWLLARLSRYLPSRIIFCSRRSLDIHVKLGYDPHKCVLIPNGFDLAEFGTRPAWRSELRAALGLSSAEFVTGTVGRLDPQKDYPTLVSAAGEALTRGVCPKVLVVGSGLTWGQPEVESWFERYPPELRQQFIFLGPRKDIPQILNALDCFTLTSSSEAFPNVLGEAMACGLPCVTTDVGDASEIVGTTGIVVNPGDGVGIAEAWRKLMENSELRTKLGVLARERVQANYDIGEIANAYLNLYQEVMRGQSVRD